MFCGFGFFCHIICMSDFPMEKEALFGQVGLKGTNLQLHCYSRE